MILIRNILVVFGLMALALFGLIWSAQHFGVDDPNTAGHSNAAPVLTGLVWHESAPHQQGCFRFALAPADEGSWQLEGFCYSAAADGTVEAQGASVSAEDWQVLRTLVESMTLAPYTEPSPDAPQASDAVSGRFALQYSDGSSTRYALPEQDDYRAALLEALTLLTEANCA